jgi:WD40 repeat protein
VKVRIFRILPILLCLIFAFSPAAAQDTGWPVEERCVGEATQPPEGWTFPGVILMTGHYGIHAVSADVPTPYVVAFIPRVPRDGAETATGVLSPDQRWYATTEAAINYSGLLAEVSVYKIVIYSTVSAREKYEMGWENIYEAHNARSIRWRDNDHIIYETTQTPKIGDDYSRDKAFLINPFTQEMTKWNGQLDPLAIIDFFPSPDWTRAVYNQVWYDIAPDVKDDWGLFDPINESQPILNLSLANLSQIGWSPDSAQFAAETETTSDSGELNNQLELFDRDGVNLGSIFLETNRQRIRNTFSVSSNIRWSSDGRYLAFITTTLNYPTVISLYIADMQEKRVYDTCIEPGDGLAWSPDGTKLAMMDFYDYKRQRPVIVLDLETWGLYTVAYHDGSVIGWREDKK